MYFYPGSIMLLHNGSPVSCRCLTWLDRNEPSDPFHSLDFPGLDEDGRWGVNRRNPILSALSNLKRLLFY